MRDTETLLGLFENLSYWRRFSNGCFGIEGHADGHNISETLEPTELDMLDVRLRPYLNHVFDEMASSKMPGMLFGNVVLATINHWRDPCMKIVDIRCMTHYTNRVRSMSWNKPDKIVRWYFDDVSLKFFAWDSPRGRARVPYVSGIYAHTIEAHEEWMDETFYDWRNRMELASMLQLDAHEVASMVLAKTAPIPPLPLNGVEFE